MSNLPKDWELKTLGELVSILTDYTANGSFASLKENVTYFNEPNFAALVRTTDLKKKEFKPERFTDKRGYEFLKKSALYGGEILMANVGSIGEVYIVPEVDFPMTLAPNMYLIKYNDNLINTYAYYFMNSSIFINQLLSKIASTTLQAVNKANFKSIKIPLPPLEEQKKIADILSTVDKKIAFVEENINATEELKKGLMQKLLTEGIGHTEFKDSELGRIPESWEVETLGKIGTFSKGKGISKNEIVENGYPCIRYAEIYTEYNFVIKEFKSFINQESANNSNKLKRNDILFAGSGETLEDIGKSVAFLFDIEAYVGGDTIILSPKDNILDSLFMAYQLNFYEVRKQLIKLGQGNSVVHIYSKGLMTVKVKFPPLEEQKQIAEILSTVDNKLENLKEKKQYFEELKKGLMQKLLTGEVRV